MEAYMGLRLKINAAVISLFSISLLTTAGLSYFAELQQAREQMLHNAETLLTLAVSTRKYTVKQVKPLLSEQNEKIFSPQTVPSYAAQETFRIFKEEFPEFSYREAALNPTNRRDLAVSWEVDIIQRFIDEPTTRQVSGERDSNHDLMFYLARPIRVANQACLTCHGDPESAPKSMLARYGKSNGFGWQMHEVVGVQILTAPASLALRTARESTLALIVSLVSVFTLMLLVINVLHHKIFVQPLQTIAQAAESYSRGNFEMTEFEGTRKDEVGALERAMNRLRRSLDKLLQQSRQRR
jgi:protein-histidine pros-kinase